MTKFDAEQEAQALLSEVGPDWTSRVWENLGWHAAVTSTCGRYYISRYPHYNGKKRYTYHCLLGEAHSHSGHWVGDGSSAQEAIQDVRKKALKDIRQYASLLDLDVYHQVSSEHGLERWTRLFGPLQQSQETDLR